VSASFFAFPLRARRYLRDRDVLRAAAVMLLAMVLTLGTVWLAYLARVWLIAARSPVQPSRRMTVLVFGRRLVCDAPGRDYSQRLARARTLMHARLADHVLLLGGCSGSLLSEAAAGHRWLRERGLPTDARVVLEEESVDSLENLRHARNLLQTEDLDRLPPVALVTSRYHLARCMLFARRLGFEGQPVAAEPALKMDARQLALLLIEATYLMWIDLGLRWAQLTGNRRMVARIS
jgi:uncharacterized SAM-binding protein YcdF (DUF218 family)